MSEPARMLIDLDGVLVDTMAEVYRRHQRAHDVCRWDYEGCCLPPGAMSAYDDPATFEDAAPIPGAIEGVHALLAAGLDVVYLSAPWPTNPDSAAAKWRWIARHDLDVRRLILAIEKHRIPGSVLVDDRPGIAGPWRHACYPQTWNEGDPNRCVSWAEGLAELLIDEHRPRHTRKVRHW